MVVNNSRKTSSIGNGPRSQSARIGGMACHSGIPVADRLIQFKPSQRILLLQLRRRHFPDAAQL